MQINPKKLMTVFYIVTGQIFRLSFISLTEKFHFDYLYWPFSIGIPALYGSSWRLCGYLMNECIIQFGTNPYDSIWSEWLVSVFVTNIRNLWSHIVLNSSERALLKELFIQAVSVVSLLATYEVHYLISTIVSHSSHPYGFMERNIRYVTYCIVKFFKNW